MKPARRTWLAGAGALAFSAAASFPLAAEQKPVRIGLSIAQTGALAGGGKASLVALRMWADDVNGRGGLLGRKVELVVYDDQSNASTTPGIYTKLIDVDKVDLLIAPYGTVPTAPIMPLVKQRQLLLLGNFAFDVNRTVKHDMWFNNAPWTDSSTWSSGFLKIGQKLGARTIAFLAADQEFAQNLANGAKTMAQQFSLQTVYDQNYPPATVDFSSMIRAIRAARPDIVYVMSYPNDSVAIVRSVNEIGVGPGVQLFGGGMVGLQFTSIMESLGSSLNGIVNYNTYVPGMNYPGIEAYFARYSQRALEAKVDPLGYYLTPFSYSVGQVLEQAVGATKTLDHKLLAEYLRKNEMQSVVGKVRYGAQGEWASARLVHVQFRNVVDKNIEQFKQRDRQIVLSPDSFRTGEIIAPFEKARGG